MIELKAIEKKYFSYLADLIFETIKMLSASPSYLKKRYTFKNLELLRSYEEQNRSFLFAVGHYGNWEWNAIVTPTVINALPLIIYKPLHNEVFDVAFKKAREKGGSVMVSMNNTMRKIIELKKQLTLTVFASDQTPVQNNQYAWIDFLNQPTAVYMGIEKIAKSTNYPVIFCDVRVLKRGYYSGEFINITSNPKETASLEITKAHVKLLEKRINEEPVFWLWSHRRWKFKPDPKDEIS